MYVSASLACSPPSDFSIPEIICSLSSVGRPGQTLTSEETGNIVAEVRDFHEKLSTTVV